MRSHLLLTLAIGAPRIFIEAIIEIIGDIGTWLSPRFLFNCLDIEFDGRLAADSANTFEFFHTEFSHCRFWLLARCGRWRQQCATLFYVVAWARLDVSNRNDHIVIVTVIVVVALAIFFAILYFTVYVFIFRGFINRAINMIAIVVSFSVALLIFVLREREKKMEELIWLPSHLHLKFKQTFESAFWPSALLSSSSFGSSVSLFGSSDWFSLVELPYNQESSSLFSSAILFPLHQLLRTKRFFSLSFACNLFLSILLHWIFGYAQFLR